MHHWLFAHRIFSSRDSVLVERLANITARPKDNSKILQLVLPGLRVFPRGRRRLAFSDISAQRASLAQRPDPVLTSAAGNPDRVTEDNAEQRRCCS